MEVFGYGLVCFQVYSKPTDPLTPNHKHKTLNFLLYTFL